MKVEGLMRADVFPLHSLGLGMGPHQTGRLIYNKAFLLDCWKGSHREAQVRVLRHSVVESFCLVDEEGLNGGASVWWKR
jgi:hypothetical protein